MAVMRTLLAAAALIAVSMPACSPPPTREERAQAAELARLAPLKQRYSGVIVGFDFAGPATLIVSLDIQAYIGTDDDTILAMKRDVLTRWRDAWTAGHPHRHATLHARWIDFVGKTILTQTVKV